MPTLQQLQTELDAVNAAYLQALKSQEIEVRSSESSRRLKRQSLDTLIKRKTDLETAISRLSGSGGYRYGVPCQ